MNPDFYPQYVEIKLRPGWKIEFQLPPDLSADEADKIAAAVKACVRAPEKPDSN